MHSVLDADVGPIVSRSEAVYEGVAIDLVILDVLCVLDVGLAEAAHPLLHLLHRPLLTTH